MGYLAATNPDRLLQTHRMFMSILFSSIIPGLLVGRTVRYVYLYKKTPHTNL